MLSNVNRPGLVVITFGYFVEIAHEGYAIFRTMFILFVGFLGVTMWAEMAGSIISKSTLD